ncbi:DUF421 domain-containing protein [Polaribacter sp. MED152]|uniref:DUF421 domain-containing protein n=1 Tax=Polaribacter sp. MED152 TaxID=313598 RepID=UPI000068C97C|nr:YetF domain-containing protein [Polaribacter sp. MED152]EAQ43077.1 protein of unknown function (DUF421) [Polaribacter sp. MED152]
MKEWIYTNSINLKFILISTIVVYIVIIVLTRMFGKRSFSKMSSFDFACTIAIGSVIASTLLSKSVPLFDGLFGLTCIFLLQAITAFLRRFDFFCKTVDNSPLLLMDKDKILWDNLKKAKVTESDLQGKLREANVIRISEIKAVVFESTGDISVLHSSVDEEIEDWLLEGVARK